MLQKKLLTEQEVEQEYGIKARTLQGWRFRRKGPPFVKLSGSVVRYDRTALDRWIAACPVGGEQMPVSMEAR